MKKIILKLILLYQAIPHFPKCRFYPSCSEYAFQAIKKYGIIKGGLKSFLRILRCNPFSKPKYDPLK